MVSFREILKPSVFFLAIFLFTVILYVVNYVFSLSPFFIFSSELIPGYLSVFVFYFILSFSSYMGSRLFVKNYQGDLCCERKRRVLILIAHVIFLLSSYSIVSYLYQLQSIGGLEFMLRVLGGDSRLGEVRSYREFTSSVALNFLLPVGISIYSYLYFQYGCKINKYIIVTIILLVLLRSFFTAARLYLLWCFMPVVINYVFSSGKFGKINKIIISALPVAIILMFIIQASLRSFSGEGSSVVYGLTQLIEYFIGGFHLSSALTIEGSPLSFPVETMRYLSTLSTGEWKETIDYYGFEQRWAKPGFNTYGMYGNAFLDYGFFYGIYAAFVGLLMGFVYRLYIAGNVLGICAFPVYISIMMDSMRISAISVTQGIIPIFCSFFVLVLFCFLTKVKLK